MISPGQHSCSSSASSDSSTSSPSSLTSSGTSSPVSPQNLRKNVRELINKVQQQQQQQNSMTTKSSSFNTKMSNRLNKNTTLTNTTSFNHKNIPNDPSPKVVLKNTTETKTNDSSRPGTIYKLNNPFIMKNFETNNSNSKINRVYKSRNKSNECRSNSKNFSFGLFSLLFFFDSSIRSISSSYILFIF